MTNASHTSVDVPFLRSVRIPTHSMDGQTDVRTDGNIVHNEHSFEGDRLSATSRAAGQWRRGSGEAEIDAFR